MPNELETAKKLVKPYLIDRLHWTIKLVSEYGRVPVQIERKNVWADYVFLHHKGL
jgi:hypothetical protein